MATHSVLTVTIVLTDVTWQLTSLCILICADSHTLPTPVQWNLFIMDTMGPAIYGTFLLLYRGFPISEVKMY